MTWTLLADGGAVLVGLFGRVIYTPEMLTGNPDNVLAVMAQGLLPAFAAGVFIAMVLSAIMSTIDSLLVVASSAGVRDYWQKVKHPEMSDLALMRMSRRVTIALSLAAFAIGMGILAYDKQNGVFWTIIFGWSGIAASFCPTMILSLFWPRLTGLGAKCAMVAGFLSVPLFEFVVPPLLHGGGMETWAQYLEDLDVLLPSFVIGFLVAIVVSLADKPGQARVAGMADELREAGR